MILKSHIRFPRNKVVVLSCFWSKGENNPLTFAPFIEINNIAIKRKDGSQVKNQTFNTDIMKNFNTLEHDTGEFFLKKNIVAYTFDSMIDNLIVMNYHGAVKMLKDELYIEFEVVNKNNFYVAKIYELVLMVYQPKILRFSSSKDMKWWW